MKTLSAENAATAVDDVDIARYPEPQAPVAPVLSASSVLPSALPRVPSILDAGPARLTTSGRVAIAHALRLLGVQPGDGVLVPAYHCAAMIEPVIWSGARPIFYKILPDASIDLDDIAGKIDGSTRALLAANYFGFHQKLDTIREFCDARGLAFIEDCAHCFLGEYRGRPVGSYGDYAIASTMKFFPLYEGGALVSARHPLDTVHLRSAGLGFEAKMAFNTLEQSFAYRRLPAIRLLMWAPMALKDALWSAIKGHKGAAPKLAPPSSEGAFGFDPSWLDKSTSFVSSLLMKTVSQRRMGEQRRRNYLRLQAALQGVPGWRPLFPALPEGVYPWVFPIVADHASAVFNTLKSQGVPIIRFAQYLRPEVTPEVCANSIALSRTSMQFPVHQELTAAELDWMINRIKEALLAHAQT